MKTKTHRLLQLFLFFTSSIMIFSACEVEFSPNAPWKEVPVVYCVLDQDDDTSWVRVEKCFLGEDSMYVYGGISDSLNYPKDSIRVRLLAYQGGLCVDTHEFQYTLRDHDDGSFARLGQPVYYNTATLQEDRMYKLEVLKASNGVLLASTDPISLIRQTTPVLIRKPANNDIFGFYERNGHTPVCRIEWNVLENARLYQPVVRFYFAEQGDTHYVDLKCATVAAGNASNILSTYYSRDAFLAELYSQLHTDTNSKQYLKTVDIYLTACDEDLNAYLSSINSGNGLEQGREVYSNIHGGLGVFAARRMHLYKNLRADSAIIVGSSHGLVYYLDSLNIGF